MENGINVKSINSQDIKLFVGRVAKLKGVKAVYLFGSFLTGKVHRNSDIDICVIIDGKEKTRERVFRIDNSEYFDIVFFDMLPLQMQFGILKEGKALIVNDKNLIDELKLRTMREYLDFKPLIIKFYKEKFGCTIS